MGRIPAILILGIALWIAWNVYQKGPEHAFGGLSELMSSPQYGEADRPTRSGSLADRVFEDEP